MQVCMFILTLCRVQRHSLPLALPQRHKNQVFVLSLIFFVVSLVVATDRWEAEGRQKSFVFCSLCLSLFSSPWWKNLGEPESPGVKLISRAAYWTVLPSCIKFCPGSSHLLHPLPSKGSYLVPRITNSLLFHLLTGVAVCLVDLSLCIISRLAPRTYFPFLVELISTIFSFLDSFTQKNKKQTQDATFVGFCMHTWL